MATVGAAFEGDAEHSVRPKWKIRAQAQLKLMQVLQIRHIAPGCLEASGLSVEKLYNQAPLVSDVCSCVFLQLLPFHRLVEALRSFLTCSSRDWQSQIMSHEMLSLCVAVLRPSLSLAEISSGHTPPAPVGSCLSLEPVQDMFVCLSHPDAGSASGLLKKA